jgi:hypothetical protein
MVVPGTSALDDREATVPRYVASGFNFVSLTVGSDRWTLEQTVRWSLPSARVMHATAKDMC